MGPVYACSFFESFVHVHKGDMKRRTLVSMLDKVNKVIFPTILYFLWSTSI